MRSLDLDFIPSQAARWRRQFTSLGALVLAAGLALAIVTMQRHFASNEKLQRLQSQAAQLERLTQPALRPKLAVKAVGEHELKQALGVRERLTVPWDTLFSSLESVRQPDVVLLYLEPKSASAEVRLTGEARDFGALLSYLDELDASKGLRGSVLVRHEVKVERPEQPIHFEIVSRWERMR